jgi:hypothetical protein
LRLEACSRRGLSGLLFQLVDQRDDVLDVETFLAQGRRDLVAFQDLAVAIDLVDLLLGLRAVARVHLEVLHHRAAARPDLEPVLIHAGFLRSSHQSRVTQLRPHPA